MFNCYKEVGNYTFTRRCTTNLRYKDNNLFSILSMNLQEKKMSLAVWNLWLHALDTPRRLSSQESRKWYYNSCHQRQLSNILWQLNFRLIHFLSRCWLCDNWLFASRWQKALPSVAGWAKSCRLLPAMQPMRYHRQCGIW